MSKTATLAFTTYGKKEDTARKSRHHLVNYLPPVVPDRMEKKEERNGISKTSGYRLGEGTTEMKKRSSSSVRSKSSLDTSSHTNYQKGGIKDSSSKKSGCQKLASNQQQATSGKANGQIKPSEEKPKIKMDEYFKKNGVDVQKTKQSCKIYNSEAYVGGKPRRDGLFLHTFSPPNGFSKEDIPDSQGMSQPEEPISPAVTIAQMHCKERETRRSRKPSNSDCSDVLQKLKEARRPKQIPIVDDVIENRSPDEENDSFPEDDSFSDSLLVRATQQVEDDVSETSNEWLNNEENRDLEGRKRDINGNNRKPAVPPSSTKSHAPPLTSTPISEFGVRRLPLPPNSCTPKSRVLGLSRARNRSGGKSSSLFESSSDCLEMKLVPCDEQEETPRKLLKFDGDESPIKIGDFDDEDDDFFSQIVIPLDPATTEKSDSGATNNKSTMIIADTSIDSFFRPEMLGELDKLEGMAILSSKSNSSIDCKNNSDSSVAACAPPSVSFEETPRTRTRRQGLSRSRRVKK